MTGLFLSAPAWLRAMESGYLDNCAGDESMMGFVLDICSQQIAHGDGGPFAAAVFDVDTGALLATGVNRVEPDACSLLHAEIVAIARAQQALGRYNLAAHGRYKLYSSAAPCAMCLGAIPWAGLSAVAVAARDEDVRAIGFDEGLKPQPWEAALTRCGIALQQDLCRSRAVQLLQEYARRGGTIYNGIAGPQGDTSFD